MVRPFRDRPFQGYPDANLAGCGEIGDSPMNELESLFLMARLAALTVLASLVMIAVGIGRLGKIWQTTFKKPSALH
jgi:hypothetical protein